MRKIAIHHIFGMFLMADTPLPNNNNSNNKVCIHDIPNPIFQE